MRTIRARPLAVVAGIAAMLVMASCIGVGYRLGQLSAPAVVSVQTSGTLDLERPENRVIVDRVGALSGRLSQLEGQTEFIGHFLPALHLVFMRECSHRKWFAA